jgi:hypothetical protein
MRFKCFLIIWLLGGSVASTLASTPSIPAPVLFFTDIISGPATGNSDTTYSTGGGAYVTLYGNFLTSPTVKLNGLNCLTVVSQPATWLWYQRMVVQIGPTCTSGNFVVTTAGGTSNGLPFSIVSGRIYYVAASGGSDSNAGTFAAPWASINKVNSTLADGGIAYFENGFTATSSGGNAIFYLDAPNCATVNTNQRASGAYPGATITLGSTSSGGTPMAVGFNGGCNGYTWFGWTLRTPGSEGLYISYATASTANNNIRLVASDVSCPNGNSESACLIDGGITTASAPYQITYYGNNIHDIGTGNNGLYHAIYHGTDYSVRDAWNEIYNVTGACRGIQIFSSTTAFEHYDMHVHDNVIHDTGCDGIGDYDTDPNITTGAYGGGAEFYNNVFYNNGTNGSAISYAFYYSEDNGVSNGSKSVEVYNNTFYNCERGCFGMLNYDGTPVARVHFHNNIMYQPSSSSSQAYFSIPSSQQSLLTGQNNIIFGAGTTLSGCPNCTGTLNADPGFVAAASANFQLSAATSPANGAGSTVATVPTRDLNGLLRPSSPSIGAFEFAPGTAVALPNPPTNLMLVSVQ